MKDLVKRLESSFKRIVLFDVRALEGITDTWIVVVINWVKGLDVPAYQIKHEK